MDRHKRILSDEVFGVNTPIAKPGMTPRAIRLGSWHACYASYSHQKSTPNVEQDLRLPAWLVYYNKSSQGETLIRCVYGAL